MAQKIQISNQQTILLVMVVTIGSNLLIIPSIFTEFARQDGWIASIIGVCIGLPVIYLYATFSQRFPNMTLAEFSEKILGKVFGKLVAFIFYIHFFIFITILIRTMGDFIKIQMMPETPLIAIHILFVAVIILGVRLGLETIARTVEICIPFIFILFTVLTIFTFPEIKSDNYLPLFEEGIKPIIRSALNVPGFSYLHLIVFLMILPFIKEQEKLRKSMMIGALGGGAILIIITTLSIGVLSADGVIRELYPSFVLAKKINIGNFLNRIEVLIAGIWFLTLYFKTTISFYALALGLAQSLKLNDYRSLTLPLGMLVLAISIIIYPNTAYEAKFFESWVPYSFTIGLILPLLMLGVAKIRKL